MKVLHKMLFRSYMGPFVLTFFIVLFVLIMQFLWKYIDEMVGKGLDFQIIVKLLFYASASFVPLALPLTVLLSSIMTFGSLAEHYELTSIKAAGISLRRFMVPLMIFNLAIAILALAFSNYVLPTANLKFGQLLYDVRQQKPALDIKKGTFYNGIDGYTLFFKEKMADNQTIKKIKIWDHSDHKGNTKLLIADSGKLTVTADQHYLLLKLYNGGMYEESRPIEKSTNSGLDTKPFMRTLFKEQEIHFDLSSFKFDQTDEDLFKDHYKMLNLKQLNHALDSMTIEINKRKYELAGYITNSYLMSKQQHYDSLNTANINFNLKEWYANLKPDQQTRLLSDAIRNANSLQGYATMIEREENYNNENMQRLSIEWHRKFTLSVACLILFFIGAPLGAIIKKGGLGTPMLFCIIFFLIYYIISMIGERSAREMAINPISGMWMSSMVLTPIAVFLLVKANRDSALLDREQYVKFFKKLFKLNKRAAA